MSYNEDAQPNEVRHARKGNTHVPAIRSSRPVLDFQHRGHVPQRGRGSNRGRGKGYNSSTLGPHVSGPQQDAVLFANGPSGSSAAAGRAGQSPFNWHGSTPDWENRRQHHPRMPKKPRLEDAAFSADVDRVAKDTEDPGIRAAALPEPLSLKPSEHLSERLSTYQSPKPDDYERTPSLEVSGPSGSTHELSSRSTTARRQPWSFDPKQPSLSISLARAFSTLPPPQSNLYDEAHTTMRPVRPPPPDGGYVDSESLRLSGNEPSLVLLNSPSLIPISVPGSPLASSVQPESPELDSERRQPEMVEPFLVARAPGVLRLENEPNTRVSRWGCWSALTRPPKVQSGTLVIGPVPETLLVVDPPSCTTAHRSHHVLQSRLEVNPLVETAAHSASSPRVVASARPEFVPERPVVMPEEDGARTISTAPNAHTVQLRKDPHDKPRRLFVLPDRGVLSVTMRGCFDIAQKANPRHPVVLRGGSITEASSPIIDDVCIPSGPHRPIVVLGHARNNQQISIVRLKATRVRELGSFDRPAQPDRNGGISAVCAMTQPDMFATGGYDHHVHLWSLSEDRRPIPSAPLSIRHTSVIQSLLAIRDTSSKLVTAGADCSVNVFDLSSERVVNTLKLSNSVYHAHPATSEFCTLLEVAHRELQFEIRDHRLVPTIPVVRFGYHSAKIHGRFVRGAVEGTTFASGGGEKDGCVRLWDLRQATKVLQTIPCLPGRKVIQVAFGYERWVMCSEDHHLAFMNRVGDLVAF